MIVIFMQVTSKEAQEMVDKALQTGLFFSAGIWTRFFPATQQ